MRLEGVGLLWVAPRVLLGTRQDYWTRPSPVQPTGVDIFYTCFTQLFFFAEASFAGI